MVLAGSSLGLCAVFTFIFGGSPLMYSPAPRGDCSNCCPIREAKDIKFLLYTKANPNVGQTLFVSDRARLEQSNFNRGNPVIIFLHGFSERSPGGPGQSGQEIRDAYLEKGNHNVILVDWSPLTALPWYVNTIQNTPRVGRYLARFVRFLLKTGVKIEKIHIIGFSLGAEVASSAGKILREGGIILPRITALDPAFPLYMLRTSSSRLSPTDARFVDVIHTDGGFLGFPWPLGHADFFPNGGVALQPGCAKQEIAKNRWINVIFGCSHQRAWEYFAESVRKSKTFLATRCEPWEGGTIDNYDNTNNIYTTTKTNLIGCDKHIDAYMGIDANEKLRGKFYLTTNSEAPFGKHANSV